MEKLTYYPEYKYVDYGLAGETPNGWIRDELTEDNIEKYRKQFNNTDFCFTAARYANKEDLQNDELPQLRGIEIDLDASQDEKAKDDFTGSLKEANTLLGYFTQVLQLRSSDIRFYYSGSRSIHITIAPEVLGLTPCVNLHRYLRQVIHSIANHLNLKLVDESIYGNRRMWRVVNVRHKKTGRYKIELTASELQLSTAEIKKISESNRAPLNEDIEYEKNEDAAKEFAALFEKAKKIIDSEKSSTLNDDQIKLLKSGKEDYDCIKDLCSNGIRKKDTYNLGEMVLVSYLKDKGLDAKQMYLHPLVLTYIKNTNQKLTSKNEHARKENFKSVANSMINNTKAHFSCACIKSLGIKDNPIKCSPKCELGILSTEKPVVYVTNGEMHKQTMLSWDAIERANVKDAYLFSFGNLPHRIEFDESNRPFLRELDATRLRNEIDKIIKWRKKTKEGDNPAFPPMAIVNNVLATRDRSLPILNRITETPIYAKDGTLNTRLGYNEKTKIYFSNRKKLIFKETSKKPSEGEIREAKELITELLIDFPFVSNTEKSHALALMFLPFVRDLISGPTPLHLFEKSTPGTGATLLVQALSHVCTGGHPSLLGEGRDSDEWRKRITSILRTSPQIVLIDNVKDRLDSASLSSALTTDIWEDRILGESENIRLPINCTWSATGNNPALSNEMARRIIRIRLDAKTDRPWQRKGFKHPNLLPWITENRADILAAIYTLINNWLINDKPNNDSAILGSYEAWSAVVGGVLKINGFEGFLSNLEEFYESSDSEGATYQNFISIWYHNHQDKVVTIAQLYDIAKTDEGSMYLGKSSEEHGKKISLAATIKKLKDRYFTLELPSKKTDITEQQITADTNTPEDKSIQKITVTIKSAGKSHGAGRWMLAVIPTTSNATVEASNNTSNTTTAKTKAEEPSISEKQITEDPDQENTLFPNQDQDQGINNDSNDTVVKLVNELW